MSGVLAKKLGRKYSRSSVVGQLVDVLAQLPARVLPGEVRVGLAEADLGQPRIIAAAGERLGEEDRPRGRRRAISAISHSQNGERLGVRVVDAEDLHAVAHPESTTPLQRLPQAAPVLGVEVDVVDVLVLLGRVLGVLQRAVGAAVEPLRVLGEPRVVGRALDGEVVESAVCRRSSGTPHMIPAGVQWSISPVHRSRPAQYGHRGQVGPS